MVSSLTERGDGTRRPALLLNVRDHETDHSITDVMKSVYISGDMQKFEMFGVARFRSL